MQPCDKLPSADGRSMQPCDKLPSTDGRSMQPCDKLPSADGRPMQPCVSFHRLMEAGEPSKPSLMGIFSRKPCSNCLFLVAYCIVQKKPANRKFAGCTNALKKFSPERAN
ncbi:hypothetical protein BZG02_08565 [Labilibaculum filiforme]|uniref:Uncharacterized protein n=1 Tax=Labilibaculum filiforme TaxID=1940526 RepID=A0A2N3HZK2_9BACT|nr:hypothetical protein BZG02_08565 [Labilibaculum filiforme]